MRKMFYWGCLFILASCSSSPQEEPTTPPQIDPDAIVRAAIERHGGANYQNSRVSFTFRKYQFTVERNGNQFQYERSFSDTLGNQYRDVLSNDDFFREINGERQELSRKDSSRYANATNSVAYFALLPYFLNDPAVQKAYLGEGMVKDKPYHKIGVTFRQEGGGKDFEDEFVYWIHQTENTLDYLAYNYLTDGGGARFREAYNAREVNGIRFQDYHNYKPQKRTRAVATFDQLFAEDGLTLLSKIETENPQVELHGGEE